MTYIHNVNNENHSIRKLFSFERMEYYHNNFSENKKIFYPGSGADDCIIIAYDSLLLSKCKIVLKCQSALSAFSKIFNPDLEIYRITCCKLFSKVPYFPEAYIPKYIIKDQNNIILKKLKTMKNPKTTIFGLIAAIGLYLANNTVGTFQVIGQIAASIGTFLTGAAATDAKSND